MLKHSRESFQFEVDGIRSPWQIWIGFCFIMTADLTLHCATVYKKLMACTRRKKYIEMVLARNRTAVFSQHPLTKSNPKIEGLWNKRQESSIFITPGFDFCFTYFLKYVCEWTRSLSSLFFPLFLGLSTAPWGDPLDYNHFPFPLPVISLPKGILNITFIPQRNLFLFLFFICVSQVHNN